MKKLSYEDFEIELIEGDLLHIALILFGPPNKLILTKLNQLLIAFEKKYQHELQKYTGNVAVFEDTIQMINEIFFRRKMDKEKDN